MTRRRSGVVSLLTAGLLLAAVLQSPAHAAATAAPTLTITPATVGNTFTAGQQVKLGFSTDATTLSWTVRDASGTEVAKGSASAASLNGQLPLSISTPGWYQTDLTGATSEYRDLVGFLDLAAERDLLVIARPGPFVMAELKNEGLPFRIYREHPDAVPLGWDGKPAATATRIVRSPPHCTCWTTSASASPIASMATSRSD